MIIHKPLQMRGLCNFRRVVARISLLKGINLKSIAEVDSQKLRGGFYTPPTVVDACLAQVSILLKETSPIALLEPSAGDGAFIRGIGQLPIDHKLRTAKVTAIELVESEAAACSAAMRRSNVRGTVFCDSFFQWMSGKPGTFNAVIGNPPFIRFQFVPVQDRELAESLLRCRGHDLNGVANYWIPFVLLSLDLLSPGGAFSIVLPSEFLSTVSAGQVRAELVRRCSSLRVDLYPRKTFPDILQDVLVLSGVREVGEATARMVMFSEHGSGGVREWRHEIRSSPESWTRYLLTSEEWEAFAIARQLPQFHPMKEVATITVAIVTGANDYFTIDEATKRANGLTPWCRSLLARTAESPGIIFRSEDHAAARDSGKKCWLLDFSASRPDPMLERMPAAYLLAGRSKGLRTRYKTSIRERWYRVPQIQRGAVMMAKRSHQHHRLILNEAGVFTTDTIYRGDMTSTFLGRERDLVATFHNSVTMLSTEIEGRTYGGGVLELVPSEIGRLRVPMVDGGNVLEQIDRTSRETGGQKDVDDSVIDATDKVLSKLVPGFTGILKTIRTARQRLRDRRFNGQ